MKLSEIVNRKFDGLEGKLYDLQERYSNWQSSVDWGSIFVGIASVSMAISLWFIWLHFGAEFAQRKLARSPTPFAVEKVVSSPMVAASAAISGGSNEAPIHVSLDVTQAAPPPTDPPTKLAELGQAGDAFGGANALFAAIAGGLVLWAGWLQRRALIEARRVNRKQQFETTFFELLKLARELESRFRRSFDQHNLAAERERWGREEGYFSSMSVFPRPIKQDLVGHEALSSWADSLFRLIQSLELDDEKALMCIVTNFHDHVYMNNPGGFGPYFRILYQTFKLIDNADLEWSEKIAYANIARGQISENAVLLLAANGLGPKGGEFIQYIQKYGLLEHMNSAFLKEIRKALLLGYKDKAFRGPSAQIEFARAVRRSFYQPGAVPIADPAFF